MKRAVYEKIFELMKAKGMTQKEFSKATGIPESTISDWKKKKYNPGLDKISAICQVLGITSKELLGIEGEEELDCRYYLSSDEIEIVESFRKVNNKDKKHILAYAKYIAQAYKEME